jgi:hypothetical protein
MPSITRISSHNDIVTGASQHKIDRMIVDEEEEMKEPVSTFSLLSNQ